MNVLKIGALNPLKWWKGKGFRLAILVSAAFNAPKYRRLFKFVNLFPAELFRIELFAIILGAREKKKKQKNSSVHIGIGHFNVEPLKTQPKLSHSHAQSQQFNEINVATEKNNKHNMATFIVFICDDVTHTQRRPIEFDTYIHSMSAEAILLQREIACPATPFFLPFKEKNAYANGSINGKINKIYKF